MAFFDLIPEEQMAPEAKEWIAAAKKRQRTDRLPRNYYVFARQPRLVRALVQAQDDLIPVPNRFGTVQGIVGMLIAHAKRCRSCFDPSREFLLKLGYDEVALDKMCATPEALPLPERDRHFVEFTLRAAVDPGGLKPDDFRALERAGFSKEEILEMLGVAAFWNFAITLASAVDQSFQAE
jgi:alkylhydroperoxidase family enzyme